MAPTPQAVLYRVFDDYGRLLYVGITNNELRRLRGDHQQSAKWLRFAHRLELTYYPTQDETRAAEVTAILTEAPVFNRRSRTREVWRAALIEYVGATEAQRLMDSREWARAVSWHPSISSGLAERIEDRRRLQMDRLIWTATRNLSAAAAA